MVETTNTAFHPAPTWLTAAYLEAVLRKYKKDNGLIITKLDVKPATAKGENYASVMTRIRVDFQLSSSRDTEQESYIVKTSYENDPFISNIMSGYDCYRTEMIMYEKVLPQLTELLREIGDNDKLFAETVHVEFEQSAIIFEDLSVTNFTIADRLTGLDVVHTKLALKKLAKMHAAASVLNERVPGCLEKFDRGIFNRHTNAFSIFFENMIEVCANFAGECVELGDYYKQKLLLLKPHVAEYAKRCYDQQEGHFHTLAHGDYWINNIMLRYTNGSSQQQNKIIDDMKIIDFQFCNWSSPAVDLHYLFNTSLESGLRLHHQEELFQYYHQMLVKTLSKFKFEGYVPTLREFCLQMEEREFYAVTSALVVQAVMINDKTDDADFCKLLMDDEPSRNFRKLLYTNKVMHDNVKTLLPYFDRKGLLDVQRY